MPVREGRGRSQMARDRDDAIEVTCPRCETVYSVTTADIRRGTWRQCPQCATASTAPSLPKETA